jgi:hypothetical protein
LVDEGSVTVYANPGKFLPVSKIVENFTEWADLDQGMEYTVT